MNTLNTLDYRVLYAGYDSLQFDLPLPLKTILLPEMTFGNQPVAYEYSIQRTGASCLPNISSLPLPKTSLKY